MMLHWSEKSHPGQIKTIILNCKDRTSPTKAAIVNSTLASDGDRDNNNTGGSVVSHDASTSDCDNTDKVELSLTTKSTQTLDTDQTFTSCDTCGANQENLKLQLEVNFDDIFLF